VANEIHFRPERDSRFGKICISIQIDPRNRVFPRDVHHKDVPSGGAILVHG